MKFYVEIVKMTDYKATLDSLMFHCRRVFDFADIPKYIFAEYNDREWIHFVPRLLVLLEGKLNIHYYCNGEEREEFISAPAMLFCTLNGCLHTAQITPGKGLSFSYYNTFIRSMLIDYDGIHQPPTSRDIYYHTNTPLSETGMNIIKTLDQLAKENIGFLGKDLLNVLFYVTIRDLQVSTAQPYTGKPHRLWDKINSFLREHCTENISRSDLGKIFEIAPGYVSELCKKHTGISLSDVKLKYQLEHAENLLLNSRLSVDEIAYESGFSSSNYFIRRFKSVYQATPHVYRNEKND